MTEVVEALEEEAGFHQASGGKAYTQRRHVGCLSRNITSQVYLQKQISVNFRLGPVWLTVSCRSQVPDPSSPAPTNVWLQNEILFRARQISLYQRNFRNLKRKGFVLQRQIGAGRPGPWRTNSKFTKKNKNIMIVFAQTSMCFDVLVFFFSVCQFIPPSSIQFENQVPMKGGRELGAAAVKWKLTILGGHNRQLAVGLSLNVEIKAQFYDRTPSRNRNSATTVQRKTE